jgi:hypothetical protein
MSATGLEVFDATVLGELDRAFPPPTGPQRLEVI